MTIELTDHIRNKVREALMLSLPEKELDEFIQAEIDKFFKSDREYGRETLSLFLKMIQGEIETRAKAVLVKWMDTHFEKIWTGSEEKLIGKAVKELAPVALEAFGEGMVQNILTRIRQELMR